ncbi:DinB family protein [Aestuariibacter sp. AA17]|uniref:DinB family protein n=1 Tax=Fluctibacter corallii TaxID=2984329 RepID=A0ABT3A4Z5_9ALTE|nr:DinB family protein [Aestuariibacter sp. AA17]MCV2883678.1 DinB family protein [Aestuariibacter sp. AA17]
MSLVQHCRKLAEYNEWMNENVYDAASQLSRSALNANRGAFFGSVLGTLNHILVGDIIWLKRFHAQMPQFASLAPMQALQQPVSLDQILHNDIKSARQVRQQLDKLMLTFTHELTDEALVTTSIKYQSMKGQSHQKPLSYLLLHVFYHQTHHRGQASTLLSQMGVDIGVTDLLMKIPDV